MPLPEVVEADATLDLHLAHTRLDYLGQHLLIDGNIQEGSNLLHGWGQFIVHVLIFKEKVVLGVGLAALVPIKHVIEPAAVLSFSC